MVGPAAQWQQADVQEGRARQQRQQNTEGVSMWCNRRHMGWFLKRPRLKSQSTTCLLFDLGYFTSPLDLSVSPSEKQGWSFPFFRKRDEWNETTHPYHVFPAAFQSLKSMSLCLCKAKLSTFALDPSPCPTPGCAPSGLPFSVFPTFPLPLAPSVQAVNMLTSNPS